MRTKRFGREVADLLRDCDRFSLPFTVHLLFLHITIILVANVVLGPFIITFFTVTHSDGVPVLVRMVLINRKSNYVFTKLQDLLKKINFFEQIKVLFKTSKEIVLLDLSKLYFNQFHRRFEPNLYRQIPVRSLMDELRPDTKPMHKTYFGQFWPLIGLKTAKTGFLYPRKSDVVMIDFCAKTKQFLVREITKENLENLIILRQELLLLLLQSNDLIDSHQFVKYDLLLMTYKN